MQVKHIHIDELFSYVEQAFDNDDDILFYYDKKVKPKTIPDACRNVVDKINMEYSDSEIRGVLIDGNKAGYFIYEGDMLISFGLNKEFRTREYLPVFWSYIKQELGDTFQCLLYSYNLRAVEFLQRCGMNILFENVTLLKFENNLN